MNESLQEKERMIVQDIAKRNVVEIDSFEVESLEQKGYVVRSDDDTVKLFCSEFERFVLHCG